MGSGIVKDKILLRTIRSLKNALIYFIMSVSKVISFKKQLYFQYNLNINISSDILLTRGRYLSCSKHVLNLVTPNHTDNAGDVPMEVSYAWRYSEVINWEMSEDFPTPAEPSMTTR